MRVFLCEKPSQGKDIARIVNADQRGSGCYTGLSVTVTWCIGHLVEAVSPDAYGDHYKRWSIEHLPIIPPRWRVEVKPSTASQFRIVKKILSTATSIVIATDADREGEMIAREILELCNYRGPVQRLWLSALNDASIRKALSSLRDGEETLPLYHAALARARADWLVGMNLSRLFTLLGRRAGYQGVLSVGRVQTPTLSLVVRRDREIARFVPAPYWAIDVQLSAGQAFVAQWAPPADACDGNGRCVRQPVAQAAITRIRAASTARVTSIDTEHVREAPPLPFDLSTLQQVCSRRLGLDVQETLDLAQALYEGHKAITYPRTDSGYLPVSMIADVPAVLNALRITDPTLGPLLDTLNRTQRSRAWDDAKITAHHGIIPTLEPIRLLAMSANERAVYELIRAHYLAQFLPHHEFDRTSARLLCDSVPLHARGKRVSISGWRTALAPSASDADADEADRAHAQILPPLTIGAVCHVSGSELKSLKTLPPKPYTQGELIAAMKTVSRLIDDPRLKQKLKDTAGIGTEATRAAIIQALIARGYLLKKRHSVSASHAASLLIDTVPAAVADPGTTALWEQALDLVATRQMTLDHFVEMQTEWVTDLIREYAGASLGSRQAMRPNT